MKMYRHVGAGLFVVGAMIAVGSRSVLAQKVDTPPPPQISTDDFPRTRDLTGSDGLTTGGSVFSFPKKPTFKLKRTITRRSTHPMPTTSKSTSTKPDSEIWKRLGVTIWRLEPGNDPPPTDKITARMLVQESGTSKEYTPKRIAADTVFKQGDRVRLAFESPTGGYLYVFDREIRADGSLGEAYQIFPTMLARGGDGRVQAGTLADLPTQADTVPYFTLKSADPNWRGELLTVVVSSEPLSGFKVADKPSPVSSSLVEALEDKYLRPASEYEQDGTAGQNYTKNEKDAGNTVTTRQLTQNDPFPQTVYQVRARSSEPLVLNLRLAVK